MKIEINNKIYDVVQRLNGDILYDRMSYLELFDINNKFYFYHGVAQLRSGQPFLGFITSLFYNPSFIDYHYDDLIDIVFDSPKYFFEVSVAGIFDINNNRLDSIDGLSNVEILAILASNPNYVKRIY